MCRARVHELLTAAAVFSPAEIAVALELFDTVYRDDSERDDHPDYRFVGAFDGNGELLGYACYGPTPCTDRTYDLYWIVVDRTVHNRGIGSIILSEVERRLRTQRARLLVVETSSRVDYAPTRAFYERRGYTQAAVVRDFYALGDDQIVYTKQPGNAPAHEE